MTSASGPGEVDRLTTQRGLHQQACETFRNQTTWVVQLGGFAVTGDALLVAYGFNLQKSLPLLIATVFPATLLLRSIQMYGQIIPLVLGAARIEAELCQDMDGPARIYMRNGFPALARKLLPQIGKVPVADQEEVVRRYAYACIPKGRTHKILLVAFLAQVVMFTMTIFTFPTPF